jgi:hypothetical protein
MAELYLYSPTAQGQLYLFTRSLVAELKSWSSCCKLPMLQHFYCFLSERYLTTLALTTLH